MDAEYELTGGCQLSVSFNYAFKNQHTLVQTQMSQGAFDGAIETMLQWI